LQLSEQRQRAMNVPAANDEYVSADKVTELQVVRPADPAAGSADPLCAVARS
jgi:hypothetical protein